jgi:hypothetical protein
MGDVKILKTFGEEKLSSIRLPASAEQKWITRYQSKTLKLLTAQLTKTKTYGFSENQTAQSWNN